ncbi:uncharacterized protein BJX67DRAFT_148313 [Aspergillus lucknowensis]|uniref:Uncharacterized protein n=1 Tax=Aspergillus lucknowensis TaxID=176173 RepID=A0ABR4LNL0_9EURO
MKRHHLGPGHGMALDSLTYTEVMAKHRKFTTLMSAEARICPEIGGNVTFVMQVQKWVLIHDMHLTPGQRGEIFREILICCTKLRYKQGLLKRILAAAEANGFREHPSSDLEDLCCPSCGVHFQADLRDCGTDGKAVVITTWMDLGSRSDVEDLKWNTLVNAGGGRDIVRPNPWEIPRRPGMHRRRFQTAPCTPPQDEDRTECNRLYLRERMYRRVMYSSPATDGFWWYPWNRYGRSGRCN